MFKSNKLPEPPKKDIETILEASVDVKGNLNSDGNVKVDGKLEGEVKVGGHLITGDPAEIKGDVTAVSALISGTIDGDVKVKGLLELTETAKITGNIEVGKIKIAEGAIFIGDCKMPEPEEEKPKQKISSQIPKKKEITIKKKKEEIKSEEIKIEPGDEV